MTGDAFAIDALLEAFDALNDAAAALSLAAVFAGHDRLAGDAVVLAHAVEAEARAVRATVRRHTRA